MIRGEDLIAKEGFPFVLGALAVFIILIIFPVRFLMFIALLFGVFCLWFFRDPERRIPPFKDIMISPADGRVVEVMETEYESREVTKISIFMNVFNVHVNRMPIGGKLKSVTHKPGKFLAADKPEASYENEQNVIDIETSYGVVTVKQVAGLIARRTVCNAKPGDELPIGERFGLIKFSSRVEIFAPKGFDISIKNGDIVKAGETVIGKYIG
ncbi:phosphatidylserine decarboxylase related protein [Denitrovibrio acetiphilus DSM 12809]|uniref:Phosphatidylserine decarboxylase proenzyme n=1 Tax=Denitrovibrio acetiphilus (strain DSM 12809 / NBRC 114555 / N2460) TaxID=522772 RepID=D4H3I3_DENA2|nr:phosphatidylserine decarboxylase family protein [Denitrovibrio acetiphilus]ADD67267.1 phosphatidylserine decarboxylase related protein [Denitrovibrio acetiphilus DSM 12809]